MFLLKAFHCLLLQSGALGALLVVMRSEVCFGELGALWRGSPGPLMMVTKKGLMVTYGMLTATVAAANCDNQFLARVRLDVLVQQLTWKKGGV